MKLRTFNQTTVRKGTKIGKPFIHLNTKTGLIVINKTGQKIIGIQAGDQVQFHQDENEPQNWYIEKVGKDGFAIRQNLNSTSVNFNSTALVRSIMNSLECVKKSARIHIGEELTYGKQTFFALITAPLANDFE